MSSGRRILGLVVLDLARGRAPGGASPRTLSITASKIFSRGLKRTPHSTATIWPFWYSRTCPNGSWRSCAVTGAGRRRRRVEVECVHSSYSEAGRRARGIHSSSSGPSRRPSRPSPSRPCAEPLRGLVEREPRRVGNLDAHRLRSIAPDLAPLVAHQEERHDLEHPLALPRVDVAERFRAWRCSSRETRPSSTSRSAAARSFPPRRARPSASTQWPSGLPAAGSRRPTCHRAGGRVSTTPPLRILAASI